MPGARMKRALVAPIPVPDQALSAGSAVPGTGRFFSFRPPVEMKSGHDGRHSRVATDTMIFTGY
jgi:hypothetical protein